MASWIDPYCVHSFNSIPFWQQGQGGMDMGRPTIKAAIDSLHYPGTDNNERIDEGLLHQEFSLVVASTTAHLDSLELLVDSEHSLIYTGGTVTATLEYTQDRKELPNDGTGFLTLGFSTT